MVQLKPQNIYHVMNYFAYRGDFLVGISFRPDFTSVDKELNMTIANLKEFNMKMADMNMLPKVKSEIMVNESKDNTQKEKTAIDVKESKTNSNINLEEQNMVEKIIAAAFGGF